MESPRTLLRGRGRRGCGEGRGGCGGGRCAKGRGYRCRLVCRRRLVGRALASRGIAGRGIAGTLNGLPLAPDGDEPPLPEVSTPAPAWALGSAPGSWHGHGHQPQGTCAGCLELATGPSGRCVGLGRLAGPFGSAVPEVPGQLLSWSTVAALLSPVSRPFPAGIFGRPRGQVFDPPALRREQD